MATIGNTAVTMMDIARRLDQNDKIARIIELLAKRLEIFQDMLWKEGNLMTGEKTTIRTGLPTVTWRLLNYGVQPSKSTTAQITDTCGLLEGRSEIDKDLADLNNNSAEFRLSEDKAFMEALNQEVCTTIFYGNTRVNPERFVGFAPRFNVISTDPTKSGYNVIDAGGTGSNNTSIWVVGWGDTTVHGIYPKGSTAGIEHRDLGEQTLYDNQTPPGKYQGYVGLFKWKCGLTVRDWRYVVRIANIDINDLNANAGAQANLTNLLIRATERIWDLGGASMAIYTTRDVRTLFRIQVSQTGNAHLTWDQAKDGGHRILSFDGIPIRRVDSLLTTEARVTTTEP